MQDQARAERGKERAALLRRLAVEGFLPNRSDGYDDARLVRAVYSFLAATPAPLVGLSLDDLAREKEPVNLPGVRSEDHQSWARRMSITLEALMRDGDALRILSAAAAARRGQRAG
jgi:4-alpha-glucanotransferase